MHIDIGIEAYAREIAIILSNLTLSYEWEELRYCKEDWDNIVFGLIKNLNEDNARKIKSIADRIKQALGEVNDNFVGVFQNKAEVLGKALLLEEFAFKIFSEELIRGSLFFSLSMIMKKIDPFIRKSANLGDWLIISQGRSHGSRGYAVCVHHLNSVMYENYDRRTVLICDKINGEEEIPSNVQAIILVDGTDYPDVLAHVSVRARNLKVLLAVLFDDSKISELKALVGQHLLFNVKNHIVIF